ncbi:hypothetical protein DL762_005989 [Monosporascus cannonballus]|uniref:Uncharacterized protein n=1 Tax=Monosporascus cannonballus TaxID=155416 RepID=A0ABY0H3Q0_9PEZI|nr:hypothetical protein DL762_005989 [Monosporascus cannonballus]RYO93647.1 hypothetical protein DL763_004322 [Monosporascus cannonballus]
MHPPLIFCPVGSSFQFFFCVEEDCFLHPWHSPPTWQGYIQWNRYVDGVLVHRWQDDWPLFQMLGRVFETGRRWGLSEASVANNQGAAAHSTQRSGNANGRPRAAYYCSPSPRSLTVPGVPDTRIPRLSLNPRAQSFVYNSPCSTQVGNPAEDQEEQKEVDRKGKSKDADVKHKTKVVSTVSGSTQTEGSEGLAGFTGLTENDQEITERLHYAVAFARLAAGQRASSDPVHRSTPVDEEPEEFGKASSDYGTSVALKTKLQEEFQAADYHDKDATNEGDSGDESYATSGDESTDTDNPQAEEEAIAAHLVTSPLSSSRFFTSSRLWSDEVEEELAAAEHAESESYTGTGEHTEAEGNIEPQGHQGSGSVSGYGTPGSKPSDETSSHATTETHPHAAERPRLWSEVVRAPMTRSHASTKITPTITNGGEGSHAENESNTPNTDGCPSLNEEIRTGTGEPISNTGSGSDTSSTDGSPKKKPAAVAEPGPIGNEPRGSHRASSSWSGESASSSRQCTRVPSQASTVTVGKQRAEPTAAANAYTAGRKPDGTVADASGHGPQKYEATELRAKSPVAADSSTVGDALDTPAAQPEGEGPEIRPRPRLWSHLFK